MIFPSAGTAFSRGPKVAGRRGRSAPRARRLTWIAIAAALANNNIAFYAAWHRRLRSSQNRPHHACIKRRNRACPKGAINWDAPLCSKRPDIVIRMFNASIRSVSKAVTSFAVIAVASAANLIACTSDSGANEIAVERAQATAEAAIIARNDAISERDDAVARAEIVETSADRLMAIKDRGNLVCATGNDTPGFHSLDAVGNSIGFDVDLCRAVAAAILSDADAVEFRFTDLAERGPALQSGEIDLMNLTTTWTSNRDINWGNFAPVMFYDGQGFMTRKDLAIESALELDGAAICVTSGTTTELNLADYIRQHNLNAEATVFEQSDVAFDAYGAGQCDAFTTDRSGLASLLTEFPKPEDHLILPEIISEEPLTPVVPHGDEAWFDVVKIVMAGLIYAEAYGIDSTNVDTMANSETIKAKRLLGTEGDFGQEAIGLNKTFMQDVIKQVGNYGEIYERNLGTDGIGLPREGRNDLWVNGGQIYAPPLR